MEKRDNENLLAWYAGREWDSIVSLELPYHSTCYQEYTRSKKELRPSNEFTAVKNFINERIVQNNEVLTISVIMDVYTESNERSITKQYLHDYLMENFSSEIDSWTPKYGEKFYFHSNVEEGQIIEILTREIDRLKQEKAKTVTVDEKLADVALAVRNQIKATPKTFDSWPPEEHLLMSGKTEVPKLLFDFLRKVVHRKSKLSEKKIRVINSICQDIIYCASNGSHRTRKHVYLSLCMKRKTGSKEALY